MSSNDTMSKPNTSSLLEKDIEIVGDVSFKGELYLQGRINGNIEGPTEQTSNAALYVQQGSEVNGEIRAATMVVAGKISGDVFASRLLTLKASAELSGNVHYSEIRIEEGATVNGSMMALGKGAAAKS